MDKDILLKEQSYLETVQTVIKEEIKELQEKIDANERQVKNSLQYVATERLDKYEIADVRGEIAGRDFSIDTFTRDKNMFNRILPKPFFAKISIKEGNYAPEEYYIGLKNLSKGEEQYIIDWRTPIASLLYFSSLGKSYYNAPMGKIDVDLLLKRQFRLEPNKIVSYIDTNTKIDDDILQEILTKNTSSHMSNIVESIQEEQNAIIRKKPNETVIINGIAGSGKTSVAMHRISYILYANKGNIASENVLVISPSKLFSTYIGDLLPELGEENVRSCSMLQAIREAGLAPKTYGSKLNMVDSQFVDSERKKEIDIKFSTKFFDEVNEFLKSYDIVTPVFLALNRADLKIPIELLRKLKIVRTPDIRQNIEQLISTALSYYYPKANGRTLERAVSKTIQCLGKHPSVTEVIDKLYQKFNLHLAESPMGYEDAPIYAYINSKLTEVEPNHFIKHIFVDEMQDYDPFSITLLRKIYPSATMTLTGDYNQNILSTQSNLEILERLFPHVKIDNLNVSYRSTNDIIEFSQKIVGSSANTRFVRKGSKPTVKQCKTGKDLVDMVNSIINSYPNDKIAVVAKSFAEVDKLSKLLPEFTFIKDENDDALLTSNKIITTTYLSKGLEYDRVILPNADISNFNTSLDRQNLYVACTRALHGLYVAYSDTLTPFIKLEVKKTEKTPATPFQKEDEVAVTP